MPTAKKLPSGSWRCLAYSHSVPVFDKNGRPIIDPKTQKQKMKRIYESFTSDDPTKRGKAEVERQAAEYQLRRETNAGRKQSKNGNITLKEAMKSYIELTTPVLSGTTTQGYDKDQYDSYTFLMDKKLKDITSDDLQIAVDFDTKRVSKRCKIKRTCISPKTVRNAYSFIITVIRYFYPGDNYDVKLPKVPKKIKELLPPHTVLKIIHGTDIELPCLLACWLSFSMSEIRGIRVKDISNGYLTLNQVIVDVHCSAVVKECGKADLRLRRHKIPDYLQTLIDQETAGKSPDDPLISLSGHAVYMRWSRLLEQNHLPHMTFHDLRHLNASIMALLRIPDKYAQERGGWSSDRVMKRVYTHTFSKEREKVDETIDHYFEDLLGVKKEPIKFSPEDIIKQLKKADPDNWQQVLQEVLKQISTPKIT